jgi:predicted metal-dependent HD superfamily phosphohydrolase
MGSAIYNIGAPDNEEQSAELFQEFAQDAPDLASEARTAIGHWILATKHHKSQVAENDMNYLLVRIDACAHLVA